MEPEAQPKHVTPKVYVPESLAAGDRFRNPQRPLSLGRANRSSCPTPAVRDTRRNRLNWVMGLPTILASKKSSGR